MTSLACCCSRPRRATARLSITAATTAAATTGATSPDQITAADCRSYATLRTDSEAPRKGRAIIPVNSTLRAALIAAREAALSDHVIEWAGAPVKSIRRSFARAVENAGLHGVSAHVLRHTAAVHMAEAGIPMSRISQFLGHSNTAITERVYARFAPDHLRAAADVLDFGKPRAVQ